MDTTLAEYLDHLQARGRSSATVRAVRSDLAGFRSWWEQTYRRPFSVEIVAARDIQRWRRVRQQLDGVKPSTINRALSSLRGFYHWAVANGLRVDNPARESGEVPMPDLAPQGIADEGIDALLRTAASEKDPTQRQRDQAALALLVFAGLRVQEACHLQLRDLDLEGGIITVRRGKRGKARRVPLHPDAQEMLQHYLAVRCPGGLPPGWQ